MADKVLRFTAEDNGYGATIDRMAAKLRGAFTNTGMEDILNQADSKFTNFSDKVKFIKDELESQRKYSEAESRSDIKTAQEDNMRHGYKRSNDSIAKELGQGYEKEEKVIEKLVTALNRFSEKVEDVLVPPQNNGGTPPPTQLPPRKNEGDEGGGVGRFLGGAFQMATGFALERLGEKLLNVIKNAVVQGNDLDRTELRIGRRFPINPDTVAPWELGIKNKDFLESISTTGASRRSGTNIEQETVNRLRLTGAYDVGQEQFAGLDRFSRINKQGGNILDKNQMDASRIITEILTRADRQGILGVSKNDFSMLPEKIGQVTSIMQQQYSNSERTNAASAINLMLAGQGIGGRFADTRSADTFGKLNEGISNPRSPGMRAFILETLRRSNPGKSPLELEAQMQNGIYDEGNLKSIFSSIQGVRSQEARGRILQSLGLDAQSSVRLAGASNLNDFIRLGSQGGGLSDKEFQDSQGNIRDRAEKNTLVTDEMAAYFGNAVTSFGEAVSKFANTVGKWDYQIGKNIGKELNKNKVVPAATK